MNNLRYVLLTTILGPSSAALTSTGMSLRPRLLQTSPLLMQVDPSAGKIETRRNIIMEVRRAFVLVFNPRTDNEGIYSRREGVDGIDWILCFEEVEDAERYAMMLLMQVMLQLGPCGPWSFGIGEARLAWRLSYHAQGWSPESIHSPCPTQRMIRFQDFPEPTPVEMDARFLLEFCEEGGHSLGLVRSGTVLLPPETNVPQFDWSPGTSAEGEMAPETMSLEELDEQRQAR